MIRIIKEEVVNLMMWGIRFFTEELVNVHEFNERRDYETRTGHYL